MTQTITITDKYAILAAHSSALVEKNYRECKVYGMGSRPRIKR